MTINNAFPEIACASRHKTANQSGASQHKSALIFVVNSSFLVGLKILIYSLAKNASLCELPVIFVSDEADVLRDPFVKRVGDEFKLVTQEDLVSFNKISSNRIPDIVRLDWIPKYTFLKWLIFDDWGYDQLIWIDADTIVVQPINGLLDHTSKDVYAAPVFTSSLTHGPDSKLLPANVIDRQVCDFAESNSRGNRSLNSGVMVLNRGVLNSGFREMLLASAREREVITEQSVLARVLQGSTEISRGHLSPYYNFHNSYFRLLSQSARQMMRDRIQVLHFIGAKAKPWAVPVSARATPGYQVWWQHYNEAYEAESSFREVGLAPQ